METNTKPAIIGIVLGLGLAFVTWSLLMSGLLIHVLLLLLLSLICGSSLHSRETWERGEKEEKLV